MIVTKITNSILYPLRRFFCDSRCLVIWTLIALMVPNVVLDLTEVSPVLWKVANIAMPLGAYALFMSASKRTGLIVLLALPLMIFAAFQLVLSYLYGESIIAVDMFLNVVTTNVAEATELLSNLFVAIAAVVVLYLPPLLWGAVSYRRLRTPDAFRSKLAASGLAMLLAGCLLAGLAHVTGHNRVFYREIFPINVICNLHEAVQRAGQVKDYPATSRGFSYGAVSGRPVDEREIYLFVIGETARSCNWQLGGYGRCTNPRLSKERNVVFCPRAISESNTTHKSVPMIMSMVSSENFDSISYCKSIITAMKEAGFRTHFFSNQAPNRSYTEYFGNEADDVRYADFSHSDHPYDAALLPMVMDAVTDTVHRKHFIVLHTYGSHFLYRDRYPGDFARFLPDDAIDANPGNREALINAYDNTIAYTDMFLADAIDVLKRSHCRSALLYSADHGEDIFDDKRERFLHASPNPTYWQLHVGMLLWISDTIAESDSALMANLRRNAQECVSPQKSMFNTALEIAGVTTPRFDASKSLTNSSYHFGDAVYLTDLNLSVPLEESGIRDADKDKLKEVMAQ